MYEVTDMPFRSKILFKDVHSEDVFGPNNGVPNENLQHYNGFYIEAGAGDGEIISNSLYFEINYKVIYNNNNLTDAPK